MAEQRRCWVRAGRVLGALALVAALGAGWVRPGAVAGQDDGDDEPDLAAMALTPADLDAAGFAGFTIAGATWRTAEEIVASTAAGLDVDEDETEDALIGDAGLGASYDLDLDLVDPDSSVYLASVRIRSYVSAHPDEDAAEVAFAFRSDEGNVSDVEDVDAETVGDESEVTRIGFEPEDGTAYAGYDLSLRVDRIFAGVQVQVFGNDGEEADEIDLPDLDDLEAAAETLAEKIETVLDRDDGGGRLSVQVQRLTRETAPLTYFDQYDYIDGVYAPYYGELGGEEANADGFADIDAVARYTLRQSATVGDVAAAEDLIYTAQLVLFEDEDAAETWVGDALDFLELDTRNTEIDPDVFGDGELDGLGDAAAGAAYLFDYGAGPLDSTVIYLSVGEIGAAIFTSSVPAIEADTLVEIAEAQAACLDDGACPEAVDAPALVDPNEDEDAEPEDGDADNGDAEDEADATEDADSDGDDGGDGGDDADADDDNADGDGDVDSDGTDPSADDEPDADEETEPADDEETAAEDRDDDADADEAGEGGVDGNTYESPQYGFRLTWDEDEWAVLTEDQDPDDSYDQVFLFNGVSQVVVTGDPDYDTDDPDELEGCVQDYARILDQADGISDVAPLDERDASGAEDTIAWATFTYTRDDDGTEREVTRYYGCQTIGEGLVLVVLHDAAADDYEDEIAAREALLEGFEAPEAEE